MNIIKNSHLKILTLICGVAMTTNTMASKDNAFMNEDVSQAMKTDFSVPLRFCTEIGELNIRISNAANETDYHYLRPLNLKNPAEFIQMSHAMYLKRIEARLAEEKQLTEELQAEITKSTLNKSFVNVNKGKKRAYEESDMNDEPEKKRVKYVVDNPVFPVKYQAYEFEGLDKFAFPHSIVSIYWSFERNDNTDFGTDLNMFQDATTFYTYVQNSFIEGALKKSKALEDKKFELIRNIMYS